MLSKILFEPGHPRQIIPITYTNASFLRGTVAKLEVSCHPKIVQSVEDDPHSASRHDQTHPLDQMLAGGVENLEDREKWSLLTRELVQK